MDPNFNEEKVDETSDSNLGEEKKPTKEEKIATERKELLNRVLSGNIKSLKDRVGYILNQDPKTRNSDIELTWSFWKMFHPEIFNGITINKSQFKSLTRMNSLIRCRAKIQNEYKLFQADEEVKKFRGQLEEERRIDAIEDKPFDMPSYSVFIDETGKTDEFLSVGSLWLIEGGINTYYVNEKLTKWKSDHEIDYEFHFKNVKKQKLKQYKDFFLKFLALNPTVGFKVITVSNKGFQDKSKAITDLTFHLICKGIEHENSSGRAPLPRVLQVWLDQDEIGSDMLKLENLKERLKSQKIEGLYLDIFETLDSSDNYFIQAVDLFTAAINRVINHSSKEQKNVKDELAEFILDLVNFDLENLDKKNTEIDNSTVFNLTPKSS